MPTGGLFIFAMEFGDCNADHWRRVSTGRENALSRHHEEPPFADSGRLLLRKLACNPHTEESCAIRSTPT